MTLYGLIGHPLTHSYSKKFFTKRFQHDNLPCQYENFEIDDIAKISEIVSQNPNLAGLNVTSPYKEAIIPFLTDIDPVAKQIGSVNTIKISNSKLIGYNTDIFGFDALLTEAIGEKKVERCLVLGTGGASKAVCHCLKQRGIAIDRVSRTPGKVEMTYSDITHQTLRTHRLIVNATPMGMHPLEEEFPQLPYQNLSSRNILIDLIYNPKETLFLEFGRAFDANTFNGHTMFVMQARKSWEIWNSSSEEI